MERAPRLRDAAAGLGETFVAWECHADRLHRPGFQSALRRPHGEQPVTTA